MTTSALLSRFVAVVLTITVLTGCLYNQHIRRGDTYMRNRSYQSAIVEYEAALKERPGSAEARRKLEQAREVYFSQLHGQVDEELAAGDYEAAIERANSAYNVNPEDPGAMEMVDRVAAATLEHTQQLADQRRYGEAEWLLGHAADSLPPARAELAAERDRVESAWIEWAVASARGHEADDRPAAAALYWAQAAKISGDVDHSSRARGLAARVRDEHTLAMMISAGRRNVETTSIVNLSTAPATGMAVTFVSSKGPETYVTRVRAERSRLETQSTTRVDTVQYVSGTRTVRNPEYQGLTDDLRHARHRMDVIEDDMRRARRRYDRTGTEYDRKRYNELVDEFNRQSRYVTELRNELDRTPMEYEEEVLATHSYQVETRTRTASLEVLVKVVGPDGNVVAESLRNPMTSASDEFHAAQPIADVAEDPLDLPSDRELRERLYADAAESVLQVVQEAFDAHRARLLADYEQRSGALEAAATYVLLDPDHVDAQIVEKLVEKSHISKPVQLLLWTI